MDRYKMKVGKFVLVPSDGGKFEVTVGKDLVWSKKETGEFPDNPKLAKVIDGKLGIR
jgi:selenoprotein W-related protein